MLGQNLPGATTSWEGHKAELCEGQLCDAGKADEMQASGGLSKLWSLFGSPKLGPVLGPEL